jgi:threonine dehydrogenase-like Zn-dependent dehydrogenase
MNDALIALEAQVRADLAKTAHPGAAWLAPKQAPDGRPALDVLVVGAGQSGLAAAFGLMRSQVTNILVLDKSEEGRRTMAYLCPHAYAAQSEGFHRPRS